MASRQGYCHARLWAARPNAILVVDLNTAFGWANCGNGKAVTRIRRIWARYVATANLIQDVFIKKYFGEDRVSLCV
jgi:hypothetical protein